MRGINHHDDWGWANAPRKGGTSGGGGTNTTVSNTTPPPAFTEGLQQALTQGQAAAAIPYSNYPGQLQADFSPQQLQGFELVGASPGLANPYINAASQHFDAATTPLWQGLQQFSPEAIAQYSNPYTQNVIDATQNQFNNQNAIAANRLQGDAASRGALGGDRAGVAQGVLAGQQQLAQAPVIAGLQNQGYAQALQEFNQQQQQKLTADQANAWLNNQAGTGFGALGKEALDTNLTAAAALMGAGNQQQAQAQQSLNIPYQQFLAQQSYPFQNSAWLSGLTAQLANAAGGTASTSAPGPSPISQGVGALAGAAGLAGSLFGKNGAFGSGGSGTGFTDNTSTFGDAGSSFADSGSGFFDTTSSFVNRGGAIHRAPGGSVPSMDDDPFLSSLGAGGLGDVMEPGGFGVPLGGGSRDANGGLTMNLNPDVSVSVVGAPPNPGQPSQAKNSVTTGGGGGGASGASKALSGAASGASLGTAVFPGIGTAIGAIAGALFGGLSARGGRVPHRAPGGPVVTSGISPKTGFLLPMISVDSGAGTGAADALNSFLAATKAGAHLAPLGPQPFPGQIGLPQPSTGFAVPFFGGIGNGVIDQSFVGGGQGGNPEGGGGPGSEGGGGASGGVGGEGQGSGGGANSNDSSAGGSSGDPGGADTGGGEGGSSNESGGSGGGEARGGVVHGFGLPHRAEGGFTSTDEEMPTFGDAPAMPGFGSVGDYLPQPSAKNQKLQDIMMRESGGLNIPNRQGPNGTPLSTASGYYQMLDSTWRENAKRAGVDTEQYPTAISAPKDTQYQVASLLYDREGERPWAASAPGDGTALERNLAPEPADSGQQTGATGSAGLAEPPGERVRVHEANPWLALAEAGFATAAGRSPNALQNIGAGAVAGIRAFKSDQKEAEALATKVEDARARLEENKAYHADTLQSRRYGIDTRSEDRRAQIDVQRLRIEQQRMNQEGRGHWTFVGTNNEGLPIFLNGTSGEQRTGTGAIGMKPADQAKTDVARERAQGLQDYRSKYLEYRNAGLDEKTAHDKAMVDIAQQRANTGDQNADTRARAVDAQVQNFQATQAYHTALVELQRQGKSFAEAKGAVDAATRMVAADWTGKTKFDDALRQTTAGLQTARPAPATPPPAAFIEGKVYVDKQGNRATYRNGQWVPAP